MGLDQEMPEQRKPRTQSKTLTAEDYGRPAMVAAFMEWRDDEELARAVDASTASAIRAGLL